MGTQEIQRHHSLAKVQLPGKLTLKELLERCAEAVSHIETTVSAPPPLPTGDKRQRLCEMALEYIAAEKAREQKKKERELRLGSMPIVSSGLIEETAAPVSLTREQGNLPEKLAIVAGSTQGPDTVTAHSGKQSAFDVFGSALPTVRCVITMAAIDHEEGLLVETLAEGCEAFWDTGASVTTITDDVLPLYTFKRFAMEHEAHDRYRLDGGTGIQISCLVEFSNAVVPVDTIAVVVRRAEVPNVRKGITFGQKGLIDALRVEYIPKKIVTEDPELPVGIWGRVEVKSYRGLDGALRHY